MPLGATAVDASNVKVSDEDARLSPNVTFKANNGIVKELSGLGSVNKGAQPTASQK